MVGPSICGKSKTTARRRRLTPAKIGVHRDRSQRRVAYPPRWHELSDIELEEIKAEGGWTAYHRLNFVTPKQTDSRGGAGG